MNRLYVSTLLSAFALGAGGMSLVDSRARAAPEARPAVYPLLELFGSALSTIEKQYITPIDDKKLIQGALTGMVGSLDPHSRYLTPEQVTAETGQYAAVGLQVVASEAGPKVIAVSDNSPAARGGVQVGDVIAAIDGVSLVGESIDRAMTRLHGEVGQPVRISLVKKLGDRVDLNLIRAQIAVKTVQWHLFGAVGYVRISALNTESGNEVIGAVKALRTQNPNVKGVVIDLRGNPGGLFDQAIAVSSIFLDGGPIASQVGREPGEVKRFTSPSRDQLEGLPIAVLVNSGTAAGAEIIAAALQDRGRAKVIGLPSFGQGTVQTMIPLNKGAGGALILTTSSYYRPSGQPIQKMGVTPDLVVAKTREEAASLKSKPPTFSEASFPNALDFGGVKPAVPVPEVPPAGYDTNTGDFQLDRALAFLGTGR